MWNFQNKKKAHSPGYWPAPKSQKTEKFIFSTYKISRNITPFFFHVFSKMSLKHEKNRIEVFFSNSSPGLRIFGHYKKKRRPKMAIFFCPLWGVAIQCSHSGSGRKGEKVKNWNTDRNNGGKHVLMAKNYVNFFSGGFQKKSWKNILKKNIFGSHTFPKSATIGEILHLRRLARNIKSIKYLKRDYIKSTKKII